MTKLERIILNSRPVAFVVDKSKRFSLPGLQGLSVHDVMIYFLKQVKKVGITERAAAISFNFIMAIPAATIFLCTLIPYLPDAADFSRELFRLVRDLTPNRDTQKLLINFLDDFFNKPKTGLLSLGFLLALFYSSNAMMGVIRTFDKSLHEKQKSNFVQKRLRAIRLTLIVIFMLIGTILISVGQGALFRTVMKWLHVERANTRIFIKTINWLFILVLFLYSIGFIYKYAPSVHKRWKLISPGAVFATVLIILTTWLFSFWVENFSNFNKFYGSIGTLLILMLLVFINSYMILIGYELNITIGQLKLQPVATEKKNKTN